MRAATRAGPVGHAGRGGGLTPPRRPGRAIGHALLRERLPEALVLTVGLLATLMFAVATQRWESAQRLERLRDDTAVYAQAMRQQFQSLIAAVAALGQFFNHSDEVLPEEFERFAGPFVPRNPVIQALAWVPRVPASQRAAFEARARADGLVDFAIREQAGGQLRPAGPREDYFPVLRLVPLAGNTRALGFDVGSEPRRRAALERARDTGQPAATEPLTLIIDAADQPGVLVFVPVARAGALGGTRAERRQHLLGFALGAMGLNQLLEAALASLPPLGLDLLLLDGDQPGVVPPLLVHPAPGRAPGVAFDAMAAARDAAGHRVALEVAGRTLILCALPAPGAYPASRWPLVVLGLGGAISGALFALLRQRRGAAARLRAREELLRLAIDAARMGICNWDLVGDRVQCSRRHEDLWGFAPGEFDGSTAAFIGRIHPDDAPRFHAELARCLAVRAPYALEFRVVWPDWSVHWIAGFGEVTVDDAGRPVRMNGVVIEITDRKAVQEQMLAGGARLKAALGSMSEAVCIADTQGRFSHLNAAFAAFHRFREQGECPRNEADYPTFLEVFTIDGAVVPREQWAVPRALRGETDSNAEYRVRRKDTGETWVGSYSFAPIRGQDGVIVGAVVTARDITERRQAQLQLRRFQQIVETSHAMLLFIDRDLCFQLVNPAYAALYRRTPEALHGRPVQAVVGDAVYARLGPELLAALAGEPRDFSVQCTFPDGRYRSLEADCSPFWVGGVVQGVVASLHDVTAAEEARTALQAQRLQLEAALREAQLARIDVLTGLANRAGFEDRLEQALAQARRHGGCLALIAIDLDGFKAINDTHGHQVGDQVLQDVAAVLAENCRLGDLAGRYGGDEFALVLSELADLADALEVAAGICVAVADLTWHGSAVSASIGVAVYPDHADDLLELIRQADLAMYAAKAAGKNRVAAASPRPDR